MECKKDGSNMRKIRGRRHTYTGVTSGFGGEQSSTDTECSCGDEPCSGRRGGAGKLPVLCHKKNRTCLLTIRLSDLRLFKGDGGSIEEYEGGGKRGVVEKDTT